MFNFVKLCSWQFSKQLSSAFLSKTRLYSCGKYADLCGKVVLVTGAGSGMGQDTAVAFAKLGANLVISGIDADQLAKSATECSRFENDRKYGEILQVVADFSCDEDIKRLICETFQHYNKIDVVVNAAGIMEMNSIEKTSLEQFDRHININLRSMFHIIMLATPELIKTKGNIVNFSSVCGLRSFPDLVAYNVSKSGVDQLTKSVALDLGPKGVRCNSVNPGVIVTSLQRSGGMDEKTYEEFLERGKKTHALGRVGQPHEVTNAVLFLASEAASFITGVNLSVDGGKHAMCPR